MRKKRGKIAVLIFAGAAVIALAAAIFLLVRANVGAGGDVARAATIFYIDIDEETYFVYDDKVFGPANVAYAQREYSADGSVCVGRGMVGGLYYISEDGVDAVTEDTVTAAALSTDGSAVAYVDADGALWRYSAKNQKTEKIAENVKSEYLVISPNGKRVAYRAADGEGTYAAYAYDGRTSTKMGEDLIPVCISDSARCTYCYESLSGGLAAVYASGRSVEIASGFNPTRLYSNVDGTQLMFWEGSACYVVEDGNQKTELAGMPDSALTLNVSDLTGVASSLSAESFAFGSLAGHYYYIYNGSLIYIDDDWNVQVVSDKLEGTAGYALDQFCETAFYLADGALYRACGGAGPELLADGVMDDVSAFACTPDGSAAYYIDSEGTLWYWEETKDAAQVADGVDYVYVTHDGYALYITDYKYLYDVLSSDYEYVSTSGTLYASMDGGEGVLLSDGVHMVSVMETAAYYYCNYSENTYDLYGTVSGLEFDLLAEGIWL